MQYAYRIIIAEDDESLAAILARLILQCYPSAKIQLFGNGLDALAAYNHSRADLLFVNHGMPSMDGPTLIRTVRARGDSVPIIAMSGNPSLRGENMAAGATAFVAGAELLRQLSAILRRFAPAPRSRSADAALCPPLVSP
jgi:CheY-like chemotaxis protein